MYRVYTDHPVNNATYFNFDIYANSLSKIILNKENKTPFTIAINGKWGSGKTTLMQTLKSKLDSSFPDTNTRQAKTVWFDAWKYSECDSMLAALVSEILEEMGRKKLLDKLKAKILVGSEKVDVLKQMSDLAKILTLGNGPEFENWFRKTEYQNKLSFFDLFQSYMKTILETFILEKDNGKYTDSQGVLVIFIDDLDRCSPKNIANVLESINLFLDLEGCFFVIGTDINMIANAIDSQYQGIKNFSGIDYIKKMIQLNFDLPLLKEDEIQKFIKNELKIDPELEPYFEIILKGVKSNQREILRYLNSLNLMRILGESLKGTGYEEELLIKWSVLNFSSIDFIEEVKRRPNFLINAQDISKIQSISERETYIQGLENKQLKEKCSLLSENDKIISVLSHGTKQFTLENVDTYLFLSNIAPKEILTSNSIPRLNFEILPRSNLRKADLMGADLTEANLTEADLMEADLMGVNFIRADLVRANLIKANLTEADLTGADLMGVLLMEAFLKGANLKGANLRNADIRRAFLMEANLMGANLIGANLGGAHLTGANFVGINYDEVTLYSILNSEGWQYAIFDDSVEQQLDKMRGHSGGPATL